MGLVIRDVIVQHQPPRGYPALTATSSARRWCGRPNSMILAKLFETETTIRATAFQLHGAVREASSSQVPDSAMYVWMSVFA
jgi:hypothetical protein